MKKRKILKIGVIFCIIFCLVFSLNAWLSMDETHGFFYLTGPKLTIRIVTAFIITLQLITSPLKNYVNS